MTLAFALFFLSYAPATRADERAYKIEAAFLYNFFNYITWPGYDSPASLKEATVCMAGPSPVEDYLRYVAAKRWDERVLHIRHVSDPGQLAGCQILYLPEHPDATTVALFAAHPKGLLVTGSTPDLLKEGGMIQLEQDNERIAMKIDQGRLNAAGLNASSRLLAIARAVN